MNILDLIIKHGHENLLFMVPMRPVRTVLFISYTSSNDMEVMVPARIDTARYNPKDGYKVTLKSTYESFGKDHFYISDLQSMVDRGTIEVYISSK